MPLDTDDIELAIATALQFRKRLGMLGDLTEGIMMHPITAFDYIKQLGTEIGTVIAHARETIQSIRRAETRAAQIAQASQGVVDIRSDLKSVALTCSEIDEYLSRYRIPEDMDAEQYIDHLKGLFITERVQPLGASVSNIISKAGLDINAIRKRLSDDAYAGLSKLAPPFVGQPVVTLLPRTSDSQGGGAMPDDPKPAAPVERPDIRSPEVRKILGYEPLPEPAIGEVDLPQGGATEGPFEKLLREREEKEAAQQAGLKTGTAPLGESDPAFDQFWSFQRCVTSAPEDTPKHWESDLYPESYAQIHPSQLGNTLNVMPFHHPTVAGVLAMNCLSHSGNPAEAQLASIEPKDRMTAMTAGIPATAPVAKVPMDLDELEVRSKGQVNNRLIGISPVALGVVTSSGYSEVVKPGMSRIEELLLNTLNVNEDIELIRSTMSLNAFDIVKETK